MWLAAEGRKEAYVQGKRKEKSELAERGEICWLRRNIIKGSSAFGWLGKRRSMREKQKQKGLFGSVLKPGPARRVDPGPGRPGLGTGPGEGKNPLGNWPGETRSTRRVDPGPGPPGQTRVRPGQFF